MNKADLLGIKVTVTDVPEIIKFIISSAKRKTRLQTVSYVNVHSYYLAFKDENFKNLLNLSAVVFCDGFGVKLGARILGIKLGARMTPPDWIDDLLCHCAESHVKVFFLGDEPEVVEKFVVKVKQHHPRLHIAGYNHGFFGGEFEGNQKLLAKINSSGADVIITGMGSPLQEQWAIGNSDLLMANVALGTGALFRWYAKVEKRGPKIFTDNGFEWLWRLFVQPRKVWRRYVIELPYFFLIVMKHKLKGKGKDRQKNIPLAP